MDDVAHIGLVDTHTEGDGRNDDIYALVKEGILIICSRLRIHTCVICARLDAVCHEQLGELLHLLAAEAVDDTALAVVLLDEADDVVVYVLLGTQFVV